MNQLLATRFERLDARPLEARYLPTERRVRRLLELTEIYGEVVSLSQEDLAGMAGTTRATVNRLVRRGAGGLGGCLSRPHQSFRPRLILLRRAR